MLFILLNNDYWNILTNIRPKVGETVKIYNFDGDYCYHTVNGRDIFRDFPTWEEANYASKVIKEDFDSGWLSPEGKYYSCNFAQHIWLAEEVIGDDEYGLENKGWVKITYANGEKIYFFFPSSPFIKLTQEQIRWLSDHDFEIKEWDRPN